MVELDLILFMVMVVGWRRHLFSTISQWNWCTCNLKFNFASLFLVLSLLCKMYLCVGIYIMSWLNVQLDFSNIVQVKCLQYILLFNYRYSCPEGQ